jgi:transcriptional regulator with XRE-family HTH domain
MANKTTVKQRVPLGPTGETVRINVGKFREQQNLTYAELARKTERVGRPIPVLGLRRIEAGERRVDVDDLMALAAAFEVSPITLLMPGMPGADDPRAGLDVTGVDHPVDAAKVWHWLTAAGPLTPIAPLAFIVNAQPQWMHPKWGED